jgi:hypothetical protein
MEDQIGRRRFRWGTALAWGPWVPTLIGLGYAFRGVGNSKATGLAAVAAGLAEIFVIWGVGAMFIGQVLAIVLLVRTFSSQRWMRTIFSLLSIAMSTLMLVLVGLFLWAAWYESHVRYIGVH